MMLKKILTLKNTYGENKIFNIVWCFYMLKYKPCANSSVVTIAEYNKQGADIK